jgi:hypothetical protein
MVFNINPLQHNTCEGFGMPLYTVKQGDHLTKIAREHGFADYRTLWDHPSNANLKKKRQNPNILYPGDVVSIPEEKEEKKVTGSTEKRHRYEKKGRPLMLRMELRHWNNKPMVNTRFDLQLEGFSCGADTDKEGRFEHDIPPKAENGKLRIEGTFPLELPVKVGHLDPIEEVTGWKARLNNLGYNAGPVNDEETQQLRSAIEEFQCDYFKNLADVDGKCGPKTQAKLKEAHGC